MPGKRSPNREKAYNIYQEHGGNITNRKIAALPGEDEKVVAVWKSRDKWNVVQQSKESCTTNKKGAQPGNKNASGHGAPKKNSNAEKHGLFRKYLPEETFSIIDEIGLSGTERQKNRHSRISLNSLIMAATGLIHLSCMMK